MPSYLLLLREEPELFERMPPEEIERAIGRYRAWSDELRASGRYLASDKLTDGEGRVLRPEAGRVRVIDGPYAEAKEVMGGYYAIRAASYDEAVEIARGCPHLDYGGTIEVRAIDTLGAPDEAE
jgi:hypothetical protein